ncbi:MAG: ABC transporter permease [Candidatus Sabulitectum sp.]|nr:ABC transporter permease [Candidatus Sabulitectum sp.]
MNYPLAILIRKEIKSTTRQPVYWVGNFLSCAAFIWLSTTATHSTLINQEVAQNSLGVEQYMSSIFSQSLLVLFPFTAYVFMSLYIFAQLFTAEKLLGQMEALLTTPLRTEQLWLGKCLSMFAMIYPFVVITLFIMIWLQGHQAGSNFQLPPFQVLLMAFIGSPIAAFCVVSFLGFLSLTVKQANTVQSLVFITGFGSVYGGSYAARILINNLHPGDNLITLPLFISVLTTTLFLLTAMWLLRSKLSKDRIVRTIA